MTTTVENPVCTTRPPAEVQPLRRRICLISLVGAGVLLGLILPFPVGGRLWSQLFDLAHAPVFCLLLIVCAGFFDPGSVGLSPQFVKLRHIAAGETLLLAGGCLLLGCLGEFLQMFAGRSPSAADLAANCAGVLSGALWVRSCCVVKGRRRWWQAAAVCILVLAIARPVLGVWGAVQQSADFPVLATFERHIDLDAWAEIRSSMQRTTEWSTDGHHSLRVELFPGRFSGVNLIWPTTDWRGYDRLTWDIRNASADPLRLTLKIHDAQHVRGGYDPRDRFHFRFEVAPGTVDSLSVNLADVAVAPDTRTMEMSEIAGVELYAADLQRGHILMLDDLRLEKAENLPALNTPRGSTQANRHQPMPEKP